MIQNRALRKTQMRILVNCPIQVEFQLDVKPLTMEMDMGAAVSLIFEWTLKQVIPKAVIDNVDNTRVVLWTYTSERIPVSDGPVQ